MTERLDRFLDRIATIQWPWWAWPAFLVALALFADVASATLQPLGTEWVAWPGGGQFGETCAMITVTGQPCPQCGMTRSWVHGIRGDLVDAFLYNPSGLALFFWINVGGVLGAIRLLRRDPQALRLPEMVFFAWLMLWLIPLYLGGYLLRLAGYLPLAGVP